MNSRRPKTIVKLKPGYYDLLGVIQLLDKDNDHLLDLLSDLELEDLDRLSFTIEIAIRSKYDTPLDD